MVKYLSTGPVSSATCLHRHQGAIQNDCPLATYGQPPCESQPPAELPPLSSASQSGLLHVPSSHKGGELVAAESSKLAAWLNPRPFEGRSFQCSSPERGSTAHPAAADLAHSAAASPCELFHTEHRPHGSATYHAATDPASSIAAEPYVLQQAEDEQEQPAFLVQPPACQLTQVTERPTRAEPCDSQLASEDVSGSLSPERPASAGDSGVRPAAESAAATQRSALPVFARAVQWRPAGFRGRAGRRGRGCRRGR